MNKQKVSSIVKPSQNVCFALLFGLLDICFCFVCLTSLTHADLSRSSASRPNFRHPAWLPQSSSTGSRRAHEWPFGRPHDEQTRTIVLRLVSPQHQRSAASRPPVDFVGTFRRHRHHLSSRPWISGRSHFTFFLQRSMTFETEEEY